MSEIQAVLFDLDGTLCDTAPDFIAVLQNMRAQRGQPAVDEQSIRNAVSGGAQAMLAAAFPIEARTVAFDLLLAEFLEGYQKHCTVLTQLYPHIDSLLRDIEQAGLNWGVVTNKPLSFARSILERHALDSRCAVLICPEHVTRCKPSAEPLLLACRWLHISPQSAIFIGDDQRDIQAGQAAGMQTVVVGYGYITSQSDPSQWGANWLLHEPKSLRCWFKQRLSADFE